jgi:hypothetical protein
VPRFYRLRSWARSSTLAGAVGGLAAMSSCSPASEAKSPSAEVGTPAGGANETSKEPLLTPASDPDPAAATGATESSGGPQPAEPESNADDGLDADIAELSRSTDGEAATKKPAGAKSDREIVYRVTPKGLVIELDGLHLRPEAKPFKDKNGAYGIELVVTAESFDDRQYWVKKPGEGPLSIAGKVEAKDGKSTRFADERKGDGEELVTAGNPRRFRQRWPGRGQPKLWWGQSVTLEIGLWGMRAESERERPVRRLFVVKMVGGNHPQAVITPPTMDWGS